MITLAVITVLITAGLALNQKTRSNVEAAAITRDRITLIAMAESGVHAAMALLINDRNQSQTDSLQEDWADPEKVDGIIDEIPFEDGNLKLSIIDEMSRIQINALVQFPEARHFNDIQRAMWERFANRLISFYPDLEETDPLIIINAVKDWLDSGDDDAITGLSGAESSYYQDLDPSYPCNNGPFDHLADVSLVKGIIPEIFYGVGGIMGLANFITIYGERPLGNNKFSYEGRININTAELPVLAALLPSEDEDFAQALYDYRQETSDGNYLHDLTSPAWYKNVPGFSSIEINPALITTSSDIFRITATATLHKIQIIITAVIQREKLRNSGKWHCKVLNWQVQ